MGKRIDCDTPDYHDLHMCKLTKRGLHDEIDKRSQTPTVICRKCGSKADLKRDVCKPESI